MCGNAVWCYQIGGRCWFWFGASARAHYCYRSWLIWVGFESAKLICLETDLGSWASHFPVHNVWLTQWLVSTLSCFGMELKRNKLTVPVVLHILISEILNSSMLLVVHELAVKWYFKFRFYTAFWKEFLLANQLYLLKMKWNLLFLGGSPN